MSKFVKTIDLKSLWKNQPVKEGQSNNEIFFKWLGFNIFSNRFNNERYIELYKTHLWRTFCNKNHYAFSTYEDMNEPEDEMQINIEKMIKWLKSLKDYERPRFYTFVNQVEHINSKYVIEARIGYDNPQKIYIYSNKVFKSFN